MSRPTTAVVQIVEGDDRDKNMLMICKAARFIVTTIVIQDQ
jgi:hypothetical protein